MVIPRWWVIPMCVLFVAATASGLINPDLTPIHLTEGSGTILLLRLAGGDGGGRVELGVERCLKGQAPKSIRIDLSRAPAEHAQAARRQLARKDGPILLFQSRVEDKPVGYLHLAGKWLRLGAPAADGIWPLERVDEEMNGTWNGGTDMLLRCVEYVLAEGRRADVPVDSGTTWRQVVRAGAVPGRPAGMAAADLAGDGRLAVHVACPAGDRLLRYDAAKEAIRDVTEEVRLAARSVAAAWGDFDADGRADLASWDGKALSLWMQGANGTFRRVDVPLDGTKIPAACPGLTTTGVGKLPGILVGGICPPVLLRGDGKGVFVAEALPAAADAAAPGEAHAPLAADFTGDGMADVLLPCSKGGLLYVGRTDGGFNAPRPCAVDSAGGGGRAEAADLDADGLLDVLVAGAAGVKVFHNRGQGQFEEVCELSGEISYKAQPLATSCALGDLNNDGRLDLLLTYGRQAPLLYFNRGFRSFGEAAKLELALGQAADGLDAGQACGLWADADGDGADDLLVALPSGAVFCAYNDLGGEGAMCLQAALPAGASCGPATVIAYAGKRCLGARVVRAGGPPARFGLSAKGAYLLRYRLPGGPEQARTIPVLGKPVLVPLAGDAAVGPTTAKDKP